MTVEFLNDIVNLLREALINSRMLLALGGIQHLKTGTDLFVELVHHPIAHPRRRKPGLKPILPKLRMLTRSSGAPHIYDELDLLELQQSQELIPASEGLGTVGIFLPAEFPQARHKVG